MVDVRITGAMPFLSRLTGSDPFTGLMYAAYGVLIVHLAWSGLHRRYPKFFIYICFQLLRPLVLSLIPLRSTLYGYVFFCTQPLLWLFLFLVLLELFQRSLEDRPGIATFGRQFVVWALGGAVAISVCTLFFNLQDSSPKYVILENFLLVDQIVHLALLLFILLLTAFLGYFPVSLHRNARVHVAVFSFYFVAKTSVLVFRTASGVEVAALQDIAGKVIMTVCLLIWTFLLTKAGEERKVHSNWLSKTGDEEKLMAQLEAINATLLGTAKR